LVLVFNFGFHVFFSRARLFFFLFLPPPPLSFSTFRSAKEDALMVQNFASNEEEGDSDLRAAAAAARASQLAKLRSSTHNLRTQLVAYFKLVINHDEQTPAWQQARRAVGLQQSVTGVPRSALEMQIGW
jgi:hypothetical protein